jgi:magnesium transporter
MMSRRYQPKRKPAGLSPGTPVYSGPERTDQVRLTVMDYDGDHLTETPIDDIQVCLAMRDTSTVTWIDVDGVHQTEVLARLGEHYGLHPLTIEDIVNTTQRPKIETFPDYIFIVCRMLRVDPQTDQVDNEQISLILGRNFVMSFQEHAGDVFDPVRERLRHGKGRLRKSGADYLAYALLDAVVDNYFLAVEHYSERLEDLEARTMDNPSPELLQEIHHVKREMLLVRRAVWPLREVIGVVLREESDLIQRGTRIYLRDVHDHTIQVAEIVESFRDELTGLQDLYLSNLSHRMNEVMKVLTIIATIFVPLTFVAGVWGMNFKYMPELESRWGYPLAWAVFVAITVTMLAYFRRKRWL